MRIDISRAARHPQEVGFDPQFALGEWWGLVEGDPLLVGLVIAVIAGFAVTYMVLRLRRRGD